MTTQTHYPDHEMPLSYPRSVVDEVFELLDLDPRLTIAVAVNRANIMVEQLVLDEDGQPQPDISGKHVLVMRTAVSVAAPLSSRSA